MLFFKFDLQLLKHFAIRIATYVSYLSLVFYNTDNFIYKDGDEIERENY